MTKDIIILIAIVLLFIPAMTGTADAMCYFYLSRTCTGLVYEDSSRFLILWLFSCAGAALFAIWSGL